MMLMLVASKNVSFDSSKIYFIQASIFLSCKSIISEQEPKVKNLASTRRTWYHRGQKGRGTCNEIQKFCTPRFQRCLSRNTMLAFRKALEAGCEGMEFDVHLTKDNQLVIIHDEAIDRTSGQHGLVKDMTYDELCQVDFSYKWKGQVPFQRIPTLREYFELVKDKDILSNIELKTGVYEYPGIEKAVYTLIAEYSLEDCIISNYPDRLNALPRKNGLRA